MKFNSVDVSKLRNMLDYDAATGEFTWKHNNKPAGWVRNGYRRIQIDGVAVTAHRAAYAYSRGYWPKDDLTIDHKDQNGLNNALDNLRVATPSQQNYNSKRKPGKTGYRGVTLSGKKYRVRIGVDGDTIDLGSFDDVKEAIMTRLAANNMFCGEFAPTL